LIPSMSANVSSNFWSPCAEHHMQISHVTSAAQEVVQLLCVQHGSSAQGAARRGAAQKEEKAERWWAVRMRRRHRSNVHRVLRVQVWPLGAARQRQRFRRRIWPLHYMVRPTQHKHTHPPLN
jgi:hypothetical protein